MLDASVLVDAFTSTDRPGQAARSTISTIGYMHVGSHLRAEATSAVRRLRFHGKLGEFQARSALDSIRRLPIQLHPIEPLLPRIWELKDTITVYDAWYVALAERLGAVLVTADRRLSEAPGPTCEIRLI